MIKKNIITNPMASTVRSTIPEVPLNKDCIICWTWGSGLRATASCKAFVIVSLYAVLFLATATADTIRKKAKLSRPVKAPSRAPREALMGPSCCRRRYKWMPKTTLAGRSTSNPRSGMAAQEAPTSTAMGRTIWVNFFHKICLEGLKPVGIGNRWDSEPRRGGGGGVFRYSGSACSGGAVRRATLIWGAPQKGQKGVCSSIWPAQR